MPDTSISSMEMGTPCTEMLTKKQLKPLKPTAANWFTVIPAEQPTKLTELQIPVVLMRKLQ